MAVTLALPTQKEAVREIHDRVRQHFTRHQHATFGDAVKWLHQAEYEDKELEAGEQGMSKFSTDILWLTSLFGPDEAVDHKVMDVKRLPALRKVTILEEPENEEQEVEKTSRPRKKPSRRRHRF